MTDFLHLELVEVVDGDVQETTACHVVVEEGVCVRVDGVVQACTKNTVNVKL